MGLGTLCTLALGEWFFVAAPLALFAGAHTAIKILRDPSYRQKMGAGFVIALVLCGIGTLLGLLATGLGLVWMLVS
ncbi:MAG: hypothetical protein ACOCUS_04625 [Polyangiales bacterium]